MSAFLQQFLQAAASSPLVSYVTKGDESALEKAKKAAKHRWTYYWLANLFDQLPGPAELTVEEKRAMHAAAFLGMDEPLALWLRRTVERPGENGEDCVAAYRAAFGDDEGAVVRAAAALIQTREMPLVDSDGQPNALGRFVLSLSDEDLAATGARAERVSDALKLLGCHAAGRLANVAGSFLHEGSGDHRKLSADCCKQFLDRDAQAFEQLVAASTANEKNAGAKARALELLAEHFPDKYQAQARQVDLAILGKFSDYSYNDGVHSLQWLIKTYGAEVLPELEPHFCSNWTIGEVRDNLSKLVEQFGEGASGAALSALKHRNHEVRLAALAHLAAWGNPKHDDAIRDCMEEGFASEHALHVESYVKAAARWKPGAVADQLWKLCEHKSNPVRQAAARALAKLPDDTVPKAAGLLTAKKAAMRGAAITLLTAAQTPAALKALEARLDEEPDEALRDQILLGLEQAWEAQGRKLTRDDLDARIERAASKLKSPAAEWIVEERLPSLTYTSEPQEKLSPQAVRYLLYRQSRAKEMRPDVEAKPLYALIDRRTSGDFALALFQMYCGSAMSADDRWALAVAGLLGDDRLAPAVMQQIHKWADSKRGKLAEYAAEALALLGTDVALCAVDSLAIRYRNKQKNIGKATSEAFSSAAERLGISVDELGDRVVPWLGFEPGGPRLIEHQDKRIEARIALDFKLEFRDLAKGKKVASLPAWVPAEVKSEFKDLSATLREVVKGQLVRLENLMVRQFRWPVARWRELFLAHPLLFPFAVRLVWGLYDANGMLQFCFRSLEDGTLTNEQDETVELPTAADVTIGIIHPLELTVQQRQAWATHLADYKIQSPFLQMERPVVYPAADEANLTSSTKYKGTELNAMTFRGRAEKLGWQREVSDGGYIPLYRKCFWGAGAEAILNLEGLFISAGVESSVTLDNFCFAKLGSYHYDGPAAEKGERRLSFGQTPAIVFSETLGDLAKISGQAAET